MRKFYIILISISAIMVLFAYYYNRWKFLWELEEPRPIYSVLHHDDDTLRVVMIGDSWIELHAELKQDVMLQRRLGELISAPVKVVSKGKGHKRSRGIYDLMYKTEGYGTKSLIMSGADYCIISAGINDASANLGIRHYCHYMKMIIMLLINNKIRPVIIEAPNVNIWKLFGKRSYSFILKDYLRSLMTGSGMYHYAEYREALRYMLETDQLKDSVILVEVDSWNKGGDSMSEELFQEDQMHLNRKGYEVLDSCIALKIAIDFCHPK